MPFRNLPGVIQCRFKRGEHLISAGEKVDYVYYLQKGIVYRELVTDSGHESILTSKTSNNIVESLVGILILYRRTDPYYSQYDFIAHTNCVCYRIPSDICLEYLRQHPDLLEEVVRTAMDEYTRLMQLFLAKREGCVAGRLCDFLLERSYQTEAGQILSKKFTNVEIAKFLSVHKVTVARILRVLKETEVIVRTPQGLLLKEPQILQEYANNVRQLIYK